jgi:hypothetical protein
MGSRDRGVSAPTSTEPAFNQGIANKQLPLRVRATGIVRTRKANAADDELRLGSSGPEVQRLHHYFMELGYFPNGALRKTNPNWQPPGHFCRAARELAERRRQDPPRSQQYVVHGSPKREAEKFAAARHVT